MSQRAFDVLLFCWLVLVGVVLLQSWQIRVLREVIVDPPSKQEIYDALFPVRDLRSSEITSAQFFGR